MLPVHIDSSTTTKTGNKTMFTCNISIVGDQLELAVIKTLCWCTVVSFRALHALRCRNHCSICGVQYRSTTMTPC
jgi:hypothetical protein